jgi:hypothetical protein
MGIIMMSMAAPTPAVVVIGAVFVDEKGPDGRRGTNNDVANCSFDFFFTQIHFDD